LRGARWRLRMRGERDEDAQLLRLSGEAGGDGANTSSGAQSHIDIAPTAPAEEFDKLAPHYTIFRVSAQAEPPA
jgi:hypothetical protein